MINIAVIGLGGAGANHAETLSQIKDVKLVMVVDKNEQLAKSIAEKCGITKFSTDFNDVLNDDSIEAVTIATPPYIRENIIIPAAKAGKHILCEKPFAINMEEALRIKQACEKAGVKFMVNFGARNLPIFSKIIKMLDSGKYGKPTWIWLKYMLPAREGIFVPPEWFWKKATGGGILIENAGHLIDFVNCIMPPAENVSATMGTLEFFEPREGIKVQPDIEDLAIMTICHQGGGITVLANGCVGNGKWGVNLDITTDKCVISIIGTKTLKVEKDGIVVEEETFDNSWAPIPFGVKKFVAFLKNETDAVAGFADGIAAMKIALGAYESTANGKTVKIK